LNDLQMAQQALAHCQAIAAFTDEPGMITRTFLSEAARCCYTYLSRWMERLGMHVEVDAAGNVRGLHGRQNSTAKRILIGSHLDTVPNAGPYDGVLGVVIAISLVELLQRERLPFGIEVIGFSEEEGVRFGVPFIGSRALAGALDQQTLQITDASGVSIERAIRDFGLDVSRLDQAAITSAAGAYLEFHIEQGPVLESMGAPLAVVDSIAGQSRVAATFRGASSHAGTTPMALRRDALCAAAEWITSIERQARAMDGLVATVGRIEAKPGATNVVPGEATATLDVRHALDSTRRAALDTILQNGREIAGQRQLTFQCNVLLDQPAVPMDRELTTLAEQAVQAAGVIPHRVTSGAGHDAMVIAPKLPSAMIFLRSPGGISHHPDETVQEEDVRLALRAGFLLLQNLATSSLLT
jgi:allantoate deiminase